MKFPFFASFIVFLIWLSYELKKHSRIDRKVTKSFWEKEAEANNTRKQSLDFLDYIVIPYPSFNLTLNADDPLIREFQESLLSLQDKKIVNLTGISNTDLKLKYGAPNLPLLTEYDHNYTLLARTLYRLGESYHKSGHLKEAKELLEFAVSTTTDVSGTYHLLAAIYLKEGTPEKIDALISQAKKINSMMRNSTVRTLQELYPYNG